MKLLLRIVLTVLLVVAANDADAQKRRGKESAKSKHKEQVDMQRARKEKVEGEMQSKRERHKKVQTKATRKRMKQTKRKSDRQRAGKSIPWYRRIFK